MRSLLRSASGVVLVLGLSAGAIADARADTEYKNFGELFDAILSGDHTGRIDRGKDPGQDGGKGCDRDNGRGYGGGHGDKGGGKGKR